MTCLRYVSSAVNIEADLSLVSKESFQAGRTPRNETKLHKVVSVIFQLNTQCVEENPTFKGFN